MLNLPQIRKRENCYSLSCHLSFLSFLRGSLQYEKSLSIPSQLQPTTLHPYCLHNSVFFYRRHSASGELASRGTRGKVRLAQLPSLRVRRLAIRDTLGLVGKFCTIKLEYVIAY